jgi:hypothetical protein
MCGARTYPVLSASLHLRRPVSEIAYKSAPFPGAELETRPLSGVSDQVAHFRGEKRSERLDNRLTIIPGVDGSINPRFL